MKKKVIAIVCAVAVLAAAGGGVTWHFLGNGTKEDDNVVYVNTVKALTNLGTGNGMENRYAGVVESENTWKVEKNSEKKVKEVYVEVGQEVQVGTRTARTCAMLPEVVLFSKTENTVCRDADLFVPDIKCFIIVLIDGWVQTIRIEPYYLC